MSEIIVPSSPEDKKRLRNAVKEMSQSLSRIESEKDLQKNICEMIKEEIGLKPKHFNRLVREYHKQTHDKTMKEAEDFDTLYREVMEMNIHDSEEFEPEDDEENDDY